MVARVTANTSAAPNAETALALLAGDPGIDILVTDLTMPGRDGLALVEAARTARPRLPVVLMTGLAGADLEEEARARGIARFVAKPFEPGELAAAVGELLT